MPIRPLQQEIKSADLLIAFGGDGTILHLARTVALHRVPVLGINLGSLGFMSELELNELLGIDFEGLDTSKRLFLPENLLETQGKGQILATPLAELVAKRDENIVGKQRKEAEQ